MNRLLRGADVMANRYRGRVPNRYSGRVQNGYRARVPNRVQQSGVMMRSNRGPNREQLISLVNQRTRVIYELLKIMKTQLNSLQRNNKGVNSFRNNSFRNNRAGF
jgi:hypothetical protein